MFKAFAQNRMGLGAWNLEIIGTFEVNYYNLNKSVSKFPFTITI